MNQNNNYNLCIKNISYFSLFKEKKNKIFDIYKTTKYKYINQKYKYDSINPHIYKKDLIITKTITLNYIKNVNKDSNSERIKNSLEVNNDKNTKKNKNKLTTKKYCKNLINKFMNNSKGLIKPIMYDDTLYKKQKSMKKVEEAPKNVNTFKNNDFLNKRFNFNNINNTFNNFKINNFFKKGNYFTFKNINLNKSFEKKLSRPYDIGINKNINYKLLDDKIKDINKFNFNNNFLKDNKNIIYNAKLDFQKNNPNNKEKSFQKIENKKTNQILKTTNKHKGRKAKNSINLNIESKHTKYSPDNMMRKIKNKVLESSRLLANKILKEEIKNIPNIKCNLFNREFRKIKGSFSQELNIKYNCWFYQIKIKDIFSMEISNKYTTIEKTSNIQLINYIFSPLNENNFIKTKSLLNTPFHQFYHDIFLNENQNWKIFYGINENDNKYQIEYMIKNIQEEERELNNDSLKYINDINYLAHNYEKYFLEKKPRNVDYNNKKNDFIKNFMNNLVNDRYLKLYEEVKQLKIFYENRKSLNNKLVFIPVVIQKNDDILENSLIKNNNSIILNNNEIENKIKDNKNKNNIVDNLTLNSTNTISQIESKLNKNITLEEEIKGYYNKKIYNNINEKANLFGNEFEKNICKDKNFCNKKRKRKIKYFISCKNFKNNKNSKHQD